MGLAQKNFSDIITFTRASAATRFNHLGQLETVGNNVPRIDYDPVTKACRGLLIEEPRTNYLRNGNCAGAIVGSPGTMPTHLSGYASSGAQNGITREIVGTGIIGGFNYFDVKYSGTVTGSTAFINLVTFDSPSAIEATQGQQWTASCYLGLLAGAWPSTLNLRVQEMQNGAYLTYGSPTAITAVAVPNEKLVRVSATRSLSHASTNRVVSTLTADCNIGTVVDVTVRVAAPQLELGSFPTSYIPTSGSQATRAADVCSINTLSPWYDQNEGTIYIETRYSTFANHQPTVFIGSATDFLRLYARSLPAGAMTFQAQDEGVLKLNSSPPNIVSVNQTAKSALSYNTQSQSGCLNGGDVATWGSGSANGFNAGVVRIGEVGGVGSGYMSGHIRKLRYFPRAMTNAQLQALTA